MNEALVLLQEGASMEAIDEAATKFGMPMGPIALTDLVGLDTAVLCRQGGGRGLPRPGRDLADPGRDGQGRAAGDKKSALRFWLSDKKGEAAAEPGRRGDPRQAPDRRAGDRRGRRSPIACSCRCCWRRRACWRKGSSASRRDVDMGLILGIGFPPFRGGILRWCDTSGAGDDRRTTGEVRTAGQAIRADRDAAQAGEERARRSIRGPRSAAGVLIQPTY